MAPTAAPAPLESTHHHLHSGQCVDDPRQPNNLKFHQYFLCGGGAGFACDLVIHPLDMVRCRMQVYRGSHATAPYRGVIHAFTSIARSEGIRALYRGYGVVAVLTVPANGLYYSSYEMSKRVFGETMSGHFMSGLVAEVAVSTVWVPMDVIKQRVQVRTSSDHPEYGNSYRSFKTVWKAGGFRSLYTGYGAAMAVYMPFTGIYFAAYEKTQTLTRAVLNVPSHEDLSPTCHLVGAAFAAGFSAAVTCPLDVVKTRMQTQDASSTTRYTSVLDAVRRIYREEGLSSFRKGIVPRVTCFIPGLAISMAVFQTLKSKISWGSESFL